MTKRLFVGNLSFDTTEDTLRDAFAEWGASSAAIPTGETGRPRGFGFVEVDDEKAEAAIASMNGTMLDGRAITVNEARPRPERSGYGGGGRSGGGRSSFGGGGRFRGNRW